MRLTPRKWFHIDYYCSDCKQLCKEEIGRSFTQLKPSTKEIDQVNCLMCGMRVCLKCFKGISKARLCNLCFTTLGLSSRERIAKTKKFDRIRNMLHGMVLGILVGLTSLLLILGIGLILVIGITASFQSDSPGMNIGLSLILTSTWVASFCLLVLVIFKIPSKLFDLWAISSTKKALKM